MRRIVSVWLPRFAIERLIRAMPPSDRPRADQPLVLVEAGSKGLRLVAVDVTAEARGLKSGERLADARARVPDLVSSLHEPDRDAAVLLKLVRWSERWSPFVAPDPPDGMLLDITGVAHLFGSEAALLHDMAAKLGRLGFTVRPALAGTAAAAWALARYGSPPASSPLSPLAGRGVGGEGPAESRLGTASPVAPPPSPPDQVRGRPFPLPPPAGGEGAYGAGFAEAPSPWLGADPSPFPIVPPGAEPAALEALPVEALGLEEATCATLRRLGLKRIGQLRDLPRASLARRFRDDAAPLMVKLDQALGLAEMPIAPLKPAPVFTVRHAVAEPLISPEGVTALVEHLAQSFCAGLETAGRGALRLVVKLYRVDGSRAVVSVGLVQGSQDPHHLARLIVPRLENLDLGYGIEAATMEAVETAAVMPAQGDFSGGRAAHNAGLADLADRILNRYERLALARLDAAESHVPERAEMTSPPFAASRPPPSPSLPHKGGERRLGQPPFPPSPLAGEGWGGGAAEDETASTPTRPPLLLGRPEPVGVIAAVPEGPPVRFTWRKVTHQVVRADGPERIEPEWWRDGLARPRDYYVVEDTSGRRFWLYREGLYGAEARQPAWFVHGLFA